MSESIAHGKKKSSGTKGGSEAEKGITQNDVEQNAKAI